MITIQGTDDEIISALWDLFLYGRHAPLEYVVESIHEALIEIQEGNRAVTCWGQRYEVVEAPWTVEQDVYGCAHGRACTSVTDQEREVLEAMIGARLDC
jgi:hypothetical protein